MTDRQAAGHLARGRGQRAEYEYMAFLRKSGYIPHRVRDMPYDIISRSEDGHEWLLSQVKSYLLLPSEMREAVAALRACLPLPPHTVMEIAQSNRKRRDKGRVKKRKWVCELVKEEE